MKKTIINILLLFLIPCSFVYAGGGITHMLIASEAIQKLPDARLRHLLLDNMDAYLVGAYYPDSGYISGTHYGEDSHWDPFIYAFADYLKEKYTDPVTQNPRLVAFLFGCASHRVSDEIIHWTFYHIVRDKDFHGDGAAAHSNGDIGIDLLNVIDRPAALIKPKSWWIPTDDLLAVYKRMGLTQYTAAEITHGTTIISMAGDGERMIALGAYPTLKWKMPWTAAHYYDWPEGGILMNEQAVANYQTDLWKKLQQKQSLNHFDIDNTPTVL